MEEAHSVVQVFFSLKEKLEGHRKADSWWLALLLSWRVGSSASLVLLQAGILTDPPQWLFWASRSQRFMGSL